jgi:hypothetical protein
MFIGHLAVGFAAKRFAPRSSLGWLLVAGQMADLLFFCFFLLGWERMRVDPGNTAFTPLVFDYYPYSHSLVTTLLWAATISLLYWAITRYLAGSLTTFVVVASHWFLDAVVHRPDLPLYPAGTSLFGFGLWNSVPGTFLVEGVMFLVGTGLYLSMGNARDRIGRYAPISLIALLLMLYAGAALGPPPPSSMAVAISGLALAVVIPIWAAWIDRHRTDSNG